MAVVTSLSASTKLETAGRKRRLKKRPLEIASKAAVVRFGKTQTVSTSSPVPSTSAIPMPASRYYSYDTIRTLIQTKAKEASPTGKVFDTLAIKLYEMDLDSLKEDGDVVLFLGARKDEKPQLFYSKWHLDRMWDWLELEGADMKEVGDLLGDVYFHTDLELLHPHRFTKATQLHQQQRVAFLLNARSERVVSSASSGAAPASSPSTPSSSPPSQPYPETSTSVSLDPTQAHRLSWFWCPVEEVLASLRSPGNPQPRAPFLELADHLTKSPTPSRYNIEFTLPNGLWRVFSGASPNEPPIFFYSGWHLERMRSFLRRAGASKFDTNTLLDSIGRKSYTELAWIASVRLRPDQFVGPEASKQALIEEAKIRQRPEIMASSSSLDYGSEADPDDITEKIHSALVSDTLPTPSPSIESSPELEEESFSVASSPEVEMISSSERSTYEAVGDGLEIVDPSEGRSLELSRMRAVYERASTKISGAVFLAIDCEMWELNHSVLTEVGWAILDLDSAGARRETQHVVIAENARRRNGRYVPDARKHFDYGKSLTLPEATVYALLSALIETLSASAPLFLIFHDPSADLVVLRKLGFSGAMFSRRLSSFRNQKEGVFVVDTQRLYAGYEGNSRQRRLMQCCDALGVESLRPHNAGNDAYYTLGLFEKLMVAGDELDLDLSETVDRAYSVELASQ